MCSSKSCLPAHNNDYGYITAGLIELKERGYLRVISPLGRGFESHPARWQHTLTAGGTVLIPEI